MMTNPIGRLSTNNGAYKWMNASNSLVGLSIGGDLASLKSNEKNLRLNMLNDSLNYRAGLLQEEGMKKVQDNNIKRTFSTFA